MNDIAKNIRSEERRTLSFTRLCRFSGGVITNGELLDVASWGTKAKFTGLNVQFGDRVEILLKEYEGIQGTVRRVDGEYAGVEFDIALPQHILERLLFDNSRTRLTQGKI